MNNTVTLSKKTTKILTTIIESALDYSSDLPEEQMLQIGDFFAHACKDSPELLGCYDGVVNEDLSDIAEILKQNPHLKPRGIIEKK
tara:strand:- start:198 stop:455 length:258 start_codon:yes stop_codon:yes gene_type:complete